MHRAEKASSKICREREVEKAQELHRKKIDGVKSYVGTLTRPPPPAHGAKSHQSSTFFRRRHRQVDSKSSLVQSPKQPKSASRTASTEVDDTENCSDDGDDIVDDGEHSEIGISQQPTKSFAKLDEFRSVMVPVMTYGVGGSDVIDTMAHSSSGISFKEASAQSVQPPQLSSVASQKQTAIKFSFRQRKLRQIQSDNATLFERIKKSSAHYRNENLKKDWEQNYSYLSSICEFPVLECTSQPSPPGPKKNKSLFRKKTPVRPELPSLENPPTIHPIKTFPTSPRRPQLNLSPAFRSLRKGLPDVPSLPPLAIVVSPRDSGAICPTNSEARMWDPDNVGYGCKRSSALDDATSQSPSTSRLIASGSSLWCEQSDAVEDTSSRYKLVTTGRFIGGKYLVLTVYCGDGISNPYGFDVVATNPETAVEYRLYITKELTHLLIDTTSSSSMAQATAAAAGTNLSMELIAHSICECINFAALENSRSGEMLFLIASSAVEDHSIYPPVSDRTLMVDAKHSSMAICIHQVAKIPAWDHRRAHIYLSTRPQKSCRASMSATGGRAASGVSRSIACSNGEPSGLIHVTVRDEFGGGSVLEMEMETEEVLRLIGEHEVVSEPWERASLERILLIALQFFHIQSTDNSMELRFDPSSENNWSTASVSSSSPTTTIRTQRFRRALTSSMKRIDTAPSATTLSSPMDVSMVLQTGLVWKNAYLFVRIALTRPFDTSGRPSTRPDDEELVLNVFNPACGSYAERVLDGEQVDAMASKLGRWQRDGSSAVVVFSKNLLMRLHLDADHLGHEIITFPTLESRHAATAREKSPRGRRSTKGPQPRLEMWADSADEKALSTVDTLDVELTRLDAAATTIQAHYRGFTCRKQLSRAGTLSPAAELEDESTYSPDQASPSAAQRSILIFHAATRIQGACRVFIERRARRNAHLQFTAIRLQRVLTPPPLRSTTHECTRTHPTEGAGDEDHEEADVFDGHNDDGGDVDEVGGRASRWGMAFSDLTSVDEDDAGETKGVVARKPLPCPATATDHPVSEDEGDAQTCPRAGLKVDGAFALRCRRCSHARGSMGDPVVVIWRIGDGGHVEVVTE